ncbi:hypothetical protein AB1Y20_015560 [Prymnesium parvum]|uniref:Coiled-coil domain-containing protein 52 n=1 Tax=Prymnesium parvum TaxID=97485 RepID=A0AB34K3C6_PRYPA
MSANATHESNEAVVSKAAKEAVISKTSKEAVVSKEAKDSGVPKDRAGFGTAASLMFRGRSDAIGSRDMPPMGRKSAKAIERSKQLEERKRAAKLAEIPDEDTLLSVMNALLSKVNAIEKAVQTSGTTERGHLGDGSSTSEDAVPQNRVLQQQIMVVNDTLAAHQFQISSRIGEFERAFSERLFALEQQVGSLTAQLQHRE